MVRENNPLDSSMSAKNFNPCESRVICLFTAKEQCGFCAFPDYATTP